MSEKKTTPTIHWQGNTAIAVWPFVPGGDDDESTDDHEERACSKQIVDLILAADHAVHQREWASDAHFGMSGQLEVSRQLVDFARRLVFGADGRAYVSIWYAAGGVFIEAVRYWLKVVDGGQRVEASKHVGSDCMLSSIDIPRRLWRSEAVKS